MAQENEESWDFNAPQYVDFTVPQQLDDNADEWFDTVERVSGPNIDILPTEEETAPISTHMNLPDDCTSNDEETTAADSTDDTDTAAPPDVVVSYNNETPEHNGVLNDDNTPEDCTVDTPVEDDVHSKKANIVCSLHEWNKSKKTPTVQNNKDMQRPARVVRKSPRYSNPRIRTSSTTSNVSISSIDSNERAATPSAKRPKLTRNNSMLDKSTRGRRNNSLNSSTGSVSTANSSITGALKQHKTLKLTLPTTPSFMKKVHANTGNKVLSTEELEYQKLAQLRKELAEKKKLSELSYKKMQTSSSYVPMRSVYKPTVSQEFKFETDQRVKIHNMETRQDNTDFTSNLRHYGDASSKAPKDRITIPKPFQLSGRKRKMSGDGSKPINKFVSDAEKAIEFATKTPDRFRTLPRNKDPTVHQFKSPKATIPKTPHFETKTRKRPITAISAAEKEEREVEEIQKHNFKAAPVDNRIFKSPHIKKVAAKGVTETKGFDFETDKRIERFHETRKGKEEEKVPTVGKVNQVQRPSTAPFIPVLKHKATQPEPFKVEERSKEMMARKEEKINQVLEDEKKAHEFYANPLPDLSTVVLPEKETKPVTELQPFDLEATHRKRKIEEEILQKEQVVFKARLPSVLKHGPFVPKQSSKPLTDVSEFELNTERRAEQRQVYENHQKQREMQDELVRHQRELERDEEERKAIEKLRTEMVHKPNPIKKYKPVEILASTKPLTNAESPQLKTKLRSKITV